jgi:tetratricopeptide (TPR) repeat protein
MLRAAVNQNPLDADLRLQLIELYARLGMKATALDECERAMRLMPQNERLIQRWARLMRDEGRLADAMRTLKAALQTNPTPTLQLLLFDFQLWAGDFEGAEATLNAMRALNTPEVRWRAYLMQGIKRQFNGEHEAQPLTSERLPALLFVVNGIMNDLANELLDLKRLASDPTPDWKSLRERGEQMVVRALDFGAWLGRLQPDEATRDAHTHLQFGAYLMGQAAQQMARYLRFRKAEDLDQATLLRAEALRELTAATPPPEP